MDDKRLQTTDALPGDVQQLSAAAAVSVARHRPTRGSPSCSDVMSNDESSRKIFLKTYFHVICDINKSENDIKDFLLKAEILLQYLRRTADRLDAPRQLWATPGRHGTAPARRAPDCDTTFSVRRRLVIDFYDDGQ